MSPGGYADEAEEIRRSIRVWNAKIQRQKVALETALEEIPYRYEIRTTELADGRYHGWMARIEP